VSLPPARRSRAWELTFRVLYAGLGIIDPLIRAWWRRLPLGNVVDLEVRGRHSGRTRRVLLGLLRDGERWFLGHPNGEVAWTRNLAAVGVGTLVIRPDATLPVRATMLGPGALRDRAIRATTQHAFPGNVLYRLAWPHIRAAGVFFEISVGDEA